MNKEKISIIILVLMCGIAGVFAATSEYFISIGEQYNPLRFIMLGCLGLLFVIFLILDEKEVKTNDKRY